MNAPLMTQPRFSAILFDLDGTLVDSLRDIADAMNDVLAARRLPTHPLDAYRIFVGDGMRTLARRVLPPTLADCDALREEVLREMKQLYDVAWMKHPFPYPGIPALLHRLSAARARMGVLSNKPDAFTQRMVAHVFPDIAWACVRGAREDVPLKPAPDAALAIAAAWGLAPTDVLYVGDTATDMLTATNAGMPSVGVTWGFRDRAELAANGAHWIVDHPDAIADILLAH
jgi:phosphoglycolate phosphatase